MQPEHVTAELAPVADKVQVGMVLLYSEGEKQSFLVVAAASSCPARCVLARLPIFSGRQRRQRQRNVVSNFLFVLGVDFRFMGPFFCSAPLV